MVEAPAPACSDREAFRLSDGRQAHFRDPRVRVWFSRQVPSPELVSGSTFKAGEAASLRARGHCLSAEMSLVSERERQATPWAACSCDEAEALINHRIVDVADDAFPDEHRADPGLEAGDFERTSELTLQVVSVEIERNVDDVRRDLHARTRERAPLPIELVGRVHLEDRRAPGLELGHPQTPRVEPSAEEDELLEPSREAVTHAVVEEPGAEPDAVAEEREFEEAACSPLRPRRPRRMRPRTGQ